MALDGSPPQVERKLSPLKPKKKGGGEKIPSPSNSKSPRIEKEGIFFSSMKRKRGGRFPVKAENRMYRTTIIRGGGGGKDFSCQPKNKKHYPPFK